MVATADECGERRTTPEIDERDVFGFGTPPSDDSGTQRLTGNVLSMMFGTGTVHRESIGKYKKIGLLGRGGMGEVWEVEDPTLDRRIALKLIDDEFALDASARTRFLGEAKTMAKLEHHNVVRVYEAGKTSTGQLYIAMECIHGDSLQRWLESHHLWREILAKYLAAGRGLVAIHEAGVVHRDFKPDNVLLGDDGRVCVGDFGIASVPLERDPVTNLGRRAGSIAPQDSDEQAPTVQEVMSTGKALAGTFAYMAPELLMGMEANARSDQFSFAVAVYEGLYRQHPFYPSGAELVAILKQAKHANAWSIAQRCMARGVRTATQRGVPRRVRLALHRALHIDPDQRFADMRELLAALTETPLLRRRWFFVGAALTSVTALTVVTQLMPSPCEDVTTPVRDLWTDARAKQVRVALRQTGLPHAKSVYAYVDRSLTGFVDSWTTAAEDACESAHVRRSDAPEIYARRVTCLEQAREHANALVKELASIDPNTMPMVEDAVMHAVDLQRCTRAEIIRTTCTESAPSSSEEPARPVRTSLRDAKVALDLGRIDTAETRASEALELAETLGVPDLTVEALLTQGRIQLAHGHREEARETWRHANELAEHYGCDRVAASSLLELARLDAQDDSVPRAVVGVRVEQLANKLARLDNPPLLLADYHRVRGHIAYKDRRDDAAVVKEYERSLELTRAIRYESHPLVSEGLLNLGRALVRAGDLERGREYIEQALLVRESALGDDNPGLVPYLMSAGNAWFEIATSDDAEARKRGFASAQQYYERGVALLQAAFGPNHRMIARFHLALTRLHDRQQDFDRAVRHAKAANTIYEQTLPHDHVDRTATLEALATALTARRHDGDLEKALVFLQSALTVYASQEERVLEYEALCHAKIADAYGALGRWVESANSGSKALDLMRAADLPRDDPDYGYLHLYLGEALMHDGDQKNAVRELERAAVLLIRDGNKQLAPRALVALGCAEPLARQLVSQSQNKFRELQNPGTQIVGEIAHWREICEYEGSEVDEHSKHIQQSDSSIRSDSNVRRESDD